jgi:hypothetical protein
MIQSIPISQMAANPRGTTTLSRGFRARAKACWDLRFATGSLHDFVEDFSRDIHPDRELAIWEKIAQVGTQLVRRGFGHAASRDAAIAASLGIIAKGDVHKQARRLYGDPDHIQVVGTKHPTR